MKSKNDLVTDLSKPRNDIFIESAVNNQRLRKSWGDFFPTDNW